MTDSSPLLDQELYFSHLQASSLGLPLRVFATLDSTNQYLLDQAAREAPEGMLAVAEEQTAGRGRNRRLWHSPPGKNLYFSLLLRPAVPPVRLPQLAMLTALALRQAVLRQAPDLPLKLKWPNDLWLEERKLSGILCECSPEAQEGKRGIVLGVGLNVNSRPVDFPPELQETATSLLWHQGRPFSRERLLAEFCNALEPLYRQWCSADSLAPFLPLWRRHDLLAERPFAVERPRGRVEGTLLGYTDQGLMLMKTSQGAELISAGDVHVRPLPHA